MQGDVEFLHSEAVVNFKRKMVQEDSFISFEQKPIFYLTNNILFALSLFISLGNWFINVLLLWLVCFTRMHHWNLLIIDVICQLNLLDDFLVLEVDLIHLGWHIKIVLGALLCHTHWPVDIVGLFSLLREKLKVENILPWNSLFRNILQHRFK